MSKQSANIPNLSGSALKWIALLTMLVDHVGASVYRLYMMAQGTPPQMYTVYRVMRSVGRISFPIFIFLLLEGFYYTRSRKRYIVQMLVFALLSEIPFDLAMYRTPFYFQSQNIYWTLLLGLVAVCLMDRIKQIKASPSSLWIKYYLQGLVFLAFAFLAELLRTDYGYVGVTAIVVMYLAREGFHIQKSDPAIPPTPATRLLRGAAFTLCSLSLLLSTLSEVYALIGVIPILFYGGGRGRQIKYFFYLFYPLHLLLLYLLILLLGLA